MAIAHEIDFRKDIGSGHEEFDVIIVGAGISGIGAGYSLSAHAPEKSYVILESRDDIGGTWDLFKYPGIRSDSDMQTFGYGFKPWRGKNAIAPGHEIVAYLRETMEEQGVDKHLRLQHKVVDCSWSSEEQRWTVVATVGGGKDTVSYKARFVYSSTGYYDYDKGFNPEFPGQKDFKGPIIHPQLWPKDFDYTDKKVVVIGSGATAVTLVPSMADKAAKVTMLQRSPSYVFPLAQQDVIANTAYRFLPEKVVAPAIRAKNIAFLVLNYQLAQFAPGFMKKAIRKINQLLLPKGFDMKHFTPSYEPWDQRICAVPNGDFFKAIKSGKADVVTDRIDHFDATGISLASGEHLDADVIITATGLSLKILGGITLSVDGKKINPAEEMAFHGLMITNVPNFMFALGYTNASWTLKIGLSYELLIKALRTLDSRGSASMTLKRDYSLPTQPLMSKLKSGYLVRAMDLMPRASTVGPWQSHMNYYKDARGIRNEDFAGDYVQFAPYPSKVGQKV